MKRIAYVLVGLLAAFILAACGAPAPDDEPEPSATAAADHNDADVLFAQEMIPHHRQAIEMAEMAADRASSVEVKALAERIQQAQDPEIETMTQWLESWGEDVPAEDGHMMGDDMMGGGMMSPEEMSELMGAQGVDFDRMFLTMMTAHHEGAIEMARVEQAEGSFAPAQELAGKIIEDQQAEIDEMADLLNEL